MSSALIGALIGLVIVKLLVIWLEPRLAFYPTRGEDATPAALGIAFQEIRLRTADDETVQAWFLPHDRPRAEIVYWHGNGGNLSIWLDALAAIHREGFSVLALDYRGYGKSTGSPTEAGLYHDSDALVRHFGRTLHRPSNKVVYWGRSLGATFAAYATTVAKPDGLILESAFPDKASVIRYDPVLRLLNNFARYQFPTAAFLHDLERPVLVVHGDADSIIPFALGQELFDRLHGDKRFLRIAGADHNDFLGADRDDYWQPLREFVEGLAVHAPSESSPVLQ